MVPRIRKERRIGLATAVGTRRLEQADQDG